MTFLFDDLGQRPMVGYATRFAIGFLAVVCVSAAIWPMLPRRYEAPATIVLLAANRDDDPTAAVKQMRQTPDEYETQSQIDLISSRELADAVVTKNRLTEDREFNGGDSLYERMRLLPIFGSLLPARPSASNWAVSHKLMQRLTVSHDRRSYTVSFGYWCESAAKAAVLTRSLLDAYIELQHHRKRESIDRMTGWLQDRVNHLKDQTVSADQKIESFLNSTGLIDRGADIFLQSQLDALSRDYAAARAQEISDAARADILAAMRVQGKLEDAPDVIASSTVQKLKENRAIVAIQPGRLNSERRASTDQITAEADHIANASALQARVDRQRVAQLAGTIAEVRNSIKQRAVARIHLDALEREAKADHSVLEESLVRLNGQTSASLSIAPDIEVTAKPEPPLQATFPNPLLTTLATLMLASIAGTALALRHHISRGGTIPRFASIAPNFG